MRNGKKIKFVRCLIFAFLVIMCAGCKNTKASATADSETGTETDIADIEVFDTEPIVGQQYHVLDVCRAVGHGVYYYTSVMEDPDGNRIVVDLSAGDGSGVGNDRSNAIRKHNWIITADDTVIYRGDQIFDIVKEETF